MLLIDAASGVAFGIAYYNEGSTGAALSWATGSLVGGPLVHMVHGYPKKAAASFLLRAMGFVLGLSAILQQQGLCTDNCPAEEAEPDVALTVVAITAMLGSQLVDDLGIARESIDKKVRLSLHFQHGYAGQLFTCSR